MGAPVLRRLLCPRQLRSRSRATHLTEAALGFQRALPLDPQQPGALIRISVLARMGLADSIQFCRYAALVAE
jgi:hypothetical protein